MVYINKNSGIVKFPKVSNQSFTEIIFTNQTTNQIITLGVGYVGGNSNVYEIDLTPVIHMFETGQYDYQFINNKQEVICSGIIQFNGYNSNIIEYEFEQNVIQYNPDQNLNK